MKWTGTKMTGQKLLLSFGGLHSSLAAAHFSASQWPAHRPAVLPLGRRGISNMFRPNTRIYDAWMELFPHMPFDQNMNILFGIWYALSQLLPYLAFLNFWTFLTVFFQFNIFLDLNISYCIKDFVYFRWVYAHFLCKQSLDESDLM